VGSVGQPVEVFSVAGDGEQSGGTGLKAAAGWWRRGRRGEAGLVVQGGPGGAAAPHGGQRALATHRRCFRKSASDSCVLLPVFPSLHVQDSMISCVLSSSILPYLRLTLCLCCAGCWRSTGRKGSRGRRCCPRSHGLYVPQLSLESIASFYFWFRHNMAATLGNLLVI
jgi:hypothetical protein